VAPYVGVEVRISRHFIWMTPLADFVFFALAGVTLLALGRLRRGATSRPVVTGVFAAIAALALGLVLERLHPAAALLLAIGIGTQVGRWTQRPIRHPRLLASLAMLGALLVVGLTARMEIRDRAFHRYWLNWLPVPPAGAPNVVLLILDTVRGTSLEFLDDLRPMSPWEPVRPPTLDSLADRSVLFTKAIAPSPWTLPSHESMFTGRWANRLSDASPLGPRWAQGTDPHIPTLTEVLAGHGYLTAGFVGNLVFTSAETGLARGFLTYEDYEVSPAQTLLSSAIGRRLAGSSLLRRLLRYHEVLNRKDARTVADQFLDWHAARGDRPFFAFLNFFDAHEPYFPPDSFRRAMPPGSRWDEFSHQVGLLTGATASRNEKWDMTPEEREAHAGGYHAAILSMDLEIDRMLEELKRRGALKNTVLIIASDHGEQLGEHNLFNHNNSLYLPALHVPLMILDPRSGSEGRVVRDVVSLRDIAATVLDFAGVDAEAAGIAGHSLARYWDNSGLNPGNLAPPESAPAFAVLYRGAENEEWYPVERGPAMYSLTDSAYHYIRTGDGGEEVYDLRVDPGELANLARTEEIRGVLAGFREKLRELAPEATEPAPEQPDK
jgi:arylsulfatase A-like enzyme